MTKLRSLLLHPSDVPAAKCQIKDRVKCLAMRLDAEGNEDAQGRKWSEVHVPREKTKWACGTVMKKVDGWQEVQWELQGKVRRRHHLARQQRKSHAQGPPAGHNEESLCQLELIGKRRGKKRKVRRQNDDQAIAVFYVQDGG